MCSIVGTHNSSSPSEANAGLQYGTTSCLPGQGAGAESHYPWTEGRKPGTKCGGHRVEGIWGTEVPQWVQGRSPGTVGGWGRSPPEAEAIVDFYMHNFDRILNYFCFARATEIRLTL